MKFLFQGAFPDIFNGSLTGWGESFLSGVLDLVYSLLQFFLGWINLPPFPTSLQSSINSFLELIFDNLQLLGFFIRPSTIKVVVPLFLVFLSFDFLYPIVMWIFNKLVSLIDAIK